MEADFECQICIHQINLVVKLELLVVLYLSNNKREIVQKESQIFLNKIRLLGENWQEKLWEIEKRRLQMKMIIALWEAEEQEE